MGDLQLFSVQILGGLLEGLPYVIALMLGLAIPLILIGANSASSTVLPSTRLLCIVGLALVGTTLSQALSGRTLYSEMQLMANPMLGQAEGSRVAVLTSQICTLLTLGLASIEILRWVLRQGRLGTVARPIWVAMFAYFIALFVISGGFGVYRNPRLNDLYALLVLTSIALLAEGADVSFWRRMRWLLLLPSIASLVLMAIKPELVLQPDYGQSLIPGFTQRLFGVSDHANKMAVVACVALVLEASPLVRRRPALLVTALQLAVLLLTQSKTMIIATMVAVFFVRLAWLHRRLSRDDPWRGTAILGLFIITLGIGLSIALVFAIRSASLIAALDRIGAFSLTGRTGIWSITLGEFLKSPLTGYGPSLWDLRYRFEHRMMAVGQAHNQFVQTLGQAGAIGFATLVIYLGLMVRQVKRFGASTGGIGAGLMIVLLIECMSESPMTMAAILGWENWLHLIAFAAAAGAGSAPVKAVASPVPERGFGMLRPLSR